MLSKMDAYHEQLGNLSSWVCSLYPNFKFGNLVEEEEAITSSSHIRLVSWRILGHLENSEFSPTFSDGFQRSSADREGLKMSTRT